MQCWEDFRTGETREFGRVEVSSSEIVAFARKFDPQPFHLDEQAARRHRFGGLVASGLHTTAMGMRLLVDHVLADSSSLGSPGVKRLRWPTPTRPGDLLRARLHIAGTRLSRSRAGVGLVDSEMALINQHGETALVMQCTILFATRKCGQ